MAALRGTVRGMRGEASRLGSKDSGLTTTADTWETFTRTNMSADGAFDIRIRRGEREVTLTANDESSDNLLLDAYDKSGTGVVDCLLVALALLGATNVTEADRISGVKTSLGRALGVLRGKR